VLKPPSSLFTNRGTRQKLLILKKNVDFHLKRLFCRPHPALPTVLAAASQPGSRWLRRARPAPGHREGSATPRPPQWGHQSRRGSGGCETPQNVPAVSTHHPAARLRAVAAAVCRAKPAALPPIAGARRGPAELPPPRGASLPLRGCPEPQPRGRRTPAVGRLGQKQPLGIAPWAAPEGSWGSLAALQFIPGIAHRARCGTDPRAPPTPDGAARGCNELAQAAAGERRSGFLGSSLQTGGIGVLRGEGAGSRGRSQPPGRPGRLSPRLTPQRDKAGLAALPGLLPSSVQSGRNRSREQKRGWCGDMVTPGAWGMGWAARRGSDSRRGQPVRRAGVTGPSQPPTMGSSRLVGAGQPQPRSPGTAATAGWERGGCRCLSAASDESARLNPRHLHSLIRRRAGPQRPGRAGVPGSAVPPRREGTEVMKFVDGECPGGWRRASPGARARVAGSGDPRPEDPAPHLPPSPPQNPAAAPRPADEADRREEASGDVPACVARVAAPACFSRFGFRSFRGRRLRRPFSSPYHFSSPASALRLLDGELIRVCERRERPSRLAGPRRRCRACCRCGLDVKPTQSKLKG